MTESSTKSEDVKTEVVDPDAPLKYLRVFTDGEEISDIEELAMIPWPEAEEIAQAVNEENGWCE